MFKLFFALTFLTMGFVANASQQELKESLDAYVSFAQSVADDFKGLFASPPSCVSFDQEDVRKLKSSLSPDPTEQKAQKEQLLAFGQLTLLKNRFSFLQLFGDNQKDQLSKWEWHNRLHNFLWAHSHPECQNISDAFAAINKTFNGLFSGGHKLLEVMNCVETKDINLQKLASVEARFEKAIDKSLEKLSKLEKTFGQCVSDVKD